MESKSNKYRSKTISEKVNFFTYFQNHIFHDFHRILELKTVAKPSQIPLQKLRVTKTADMRFIL